MKTLTFVLRTPEGVVLDELVDAIVAEDGTGWFGIRRGREDLIASLPPGLLSFRVGSRERFVAHSGGLLDLSAGICRAAVRNATLGEDLDTIADALAAELRRRRLSGEAHRDVLDDLEREALRRVIQDPR